jgi:hypothetical protein
LTSFLTGFFITLPDQLNSAPYPYDAANGGIQLPPDVELRLRTLADQGYKLAALRQVVDLSGAPIITAREYLESLLSTGQPVPETNPSPLSET